MGLTGKGYQILERGGLIPPGALERAVDAGLKSNPKRLADSLFHVPRDAHLFSALEGTPGLGATQAEAALFSQLGSSLAELGPLPGSIVSLESGSSQVPMEFVSHLMGANPMSHYCLIDEYKRALTVRAEMLSERFPSLQVVAIAGDLREGVRYLKLEAPKSKWVLWTGGAINHHDPSVSEHLLRYVGAGLQAGESLLLGVDLRGDLAVLQDVYSGTGVQEQTHGLIPYLNQELGLSLRAESFQYRVEMETAPARLSLQLVTSESQTFGPVGCREGWVDVG